MWICRNKRSIILRKLWSESWATHFMFINIKYFTQLQNSGYGLGQWEKALQNNASSHWLSHAQNNPWTTHGVHIASVHEALILCLCCIKENLYLQKNQHSIKKINVHHEAKVIPNSTDGQLSPGASVIHFVRLNKPTLSFRAWITKYAHTNYGVYLLNHLLNSTVI